MMPKQSIYYKKCLQTALYIGIFGLVTFTACNKDPYLPNSEAKYVELGYGDATYGNDNDAEPLMTGIKYMTYNIHAGAPPANPGTTDLQAIADAINAADPDIVFLQEVDKNTGRNGYNGDQAKDLGELTQMNFTFYSAISYGKGFYGVAILSKYPLKGVKKYLLPKENADEEQRVMGIAMVDLPGKDSIYVAVTHLQHNSATSRVAQITEVGNIADNLQHRLLIGGDMNEKPSATDFFAVFDAHFTRGCSGVNCPNTFSAQNPTSIIDYLAYKPANAFSVKSYAVMPEAKGSDHLPVVSELNINR